MSKNGLSPALRKVDLTLDNTLRDVPRTQLWRVQIEQRPLALACGLLGGGQHSAGTEQVTYVGYRKAESRTAFPWNRDLFEPQRFTDQTCD
jgi:hypothetical protein